MRYILNEDYKLCGWKNARFAAMNIKTGQALLLTQHDFELILKCSGKKEIDEPECEFYAKLLNKNIIRVAGDGEKRTLAYTEYPGVYKSSVQWSITGLCNYRCKHCFQSAPKGVLGQPTLEMCFDIIHQLSECGIMNVALTGGEPLIRNDFFDIIDELNCCKLHVNTIYSNGSLISDSFLDALEKRGVRPAFQLSFDGVGKHDWMRGVIGAEKSAFEAMRRLKDRGYTFACAMCLCRENVGAIRDTANALAVGGCRSLKLQRSMPMGEWANQTEHFLTYEETLNAYIDYLPQYKEDGMPLDIQMEGFFAYMRGRGYTNLSDRKGKEEAFSQMPPCGVIATSLYIGPNGAVTPCMSMCGAEIEGQFPNIFQMPLKDILTDSSYTRLTGYKVKDVFEHNEKCRSCEYRCRCCTGCRAFAVGENSNDYLGIDPITCKILTEGWSDRLNTVADALFERCTPDSLAEIGQDC